MSKAILVFVALAVSLLSAVAEAAGPSLRKPHALDAVADQACLDAIAYLAYHDYERSDGPLSAMALAHVRRCNAHPDRLVCETTSGIVKREYGKTPFTCGSDTADYTMPVIIVPENWPPPK